MAFVDENWDLQTLPWNTDSRAGGQRSIGGQIVRHQTKMKEREAKEGHFCPDGSLKKIFLTCEL